MLSNLLVAALLAATPQSSDYVTTATLSIAPAVDSIYPGEPLTIRLTTRNFTDGPILTNLGWNHIGAFSFKVLDEKGTVVREAGRPPDPVGLRIPPYTTPVLPGETGDTNLLLNRWCSTHLAPGKYSCELYMDMEPMASPPRTGRLLEGKFVARTGFQVMPADEAKLKQRMEESFRRSSGGRGMTDFARNVLFSNVPFATAEKLALIEREGLSDELARAMTRSAHDWDVDLLLEVAKRDSSGPATVPSTSSPSLRVADMFVAFHSPARATNALHDIFDKKSNTDERIAAFVKDHPRQTLPLEE